VRLELDLPAGRYANFRALDRQRGWLDNLIRAVQRDYRA
jgi:hypothetical protein